MISTIRSSILRIMREGLSPAQAAQEPLAMGVDPVLVQQVVDELEAKIAENQLLTDPRSVVGATAEEAKEQQWYGGPEPGDRHWEQLHERFTSMGIPAEEIDRIDRASTKVVNYLARPDNHHLRKKGLVLGYVQSGKTANYTSVMAKAADRGYRLFIVLAGMHNNLRRQTQMRLQDDLLDENWFELTSADADFANAFSGIPFVNTPGRFAVAVVKKNPARLSALRDWLRNIPTETLRRCPTLILDDEADQATPNSAKARTKLSGINSLMRAVWKTVPTGTYVGYTATPFANVFMDPNDETELYPSDFIVDLPRPSSYFGAERIFGRPSTGDGDDPDDGLDMVRTISDDDALSIRPGAREADYEPSMVGSLDTAMRWFLLATAIRRARGQLSAHSSMLVHVSQQRQVHSGLLDLLHEHVDMFRSELEREDLTLFRKVLNDESRRVNDVAAPPLPDDEAVLAALADVLAEVDVLVDNSESDNRLDYTEKDEDGATIPRTVIVIGGNTLSRGLTLEGLLVSYFTRTSNTYDTLLQMGRWFGFRIGYEDLPRIWMQSDLREDFEFLALVEAELRAEMAYMESMGLTPKQFGVRVRQHPGRLAITQRNKMQHADLVQVDLSGQRLQTFILHEQDTEALRNNLDATRDFLRVAQQNGRSHVTESGTTTFRNLPASAVADFCEKYSFHEALQTMRSDIITRWLREKAPESNWNVVVKAGRSAHSTVDLGLNSPTPLMTRNPLARETRFANMKAIVSKEDRLLDIDRVEVADRTFKAEEDYRAARAELGDGNGLVVLYPIDRASAPRGRATTTRRPMQAEEHVIGVMLVFPDAEGDIDAPDTRYVAVRPDWDPVESDEDELIPEDTEGDAVVRPVPEEIVGVRR